MKPCKNCGNLIENDATYCYECGAVQGKMVESAVLICPKCGKKCDRKQVSCPHCGAALRESEIVKGGREELSENSKFLFVIIVILAVAALYTFFSQPIITYWSREIVLEDLMGLTRWMDSSESGKFVIIVSLILVLYVLVGIGALMRIKPWCLACSIACVLLMVVLGMEIGGERLKLVAGFWVPLLCMIGSVVCAFNIETS